METFINIDPGHVVSLCVCVSVGERCGPVQRDARAGGGRAEERRADRDHRGTVQTRR